jgi:hypothetical protein
VTTTSNPVRVQGAILPLTRIRQSCMLLGNITGSETRDGLWVGYVGVGLG